jgi:spermidine/putrescine transport system substrate-binding protein
LDEEETLGAAGQTRFGIRSIVAALVAFGAVLALAACGGGGTVGGANQGPQQTAKGGKATGDLTVSNWPGYIDPGSKGSVARFEKDTGISVKYIEDVNDNNQFFGKMQPLLQQGQSGGRSIFVVTDWMAKQMHDLGYLQNINMADVPNVKKNMLDSLRHPTTDPNRQFSIPWQSGMTGIWVDTSKAPEIHSINDLFNPKYKGKVTMLTEMRDTVPLVMKGEGIDPEKASKQDWLNAIDKIKKAVDSGQIRAFTGNEYTEDLNAGNVVASIGWSGDASLISNKNAQWRMPTQGCMIFSDNMVIPVGAPNTPAALAWMNWFYDPKNAAPLTSYILYVSPVKGVQQQLEKTNPSQAHNKLIFPPASFTKNCTPNLDPPGGAAGIAEVTKAFQNVITQ